MLILTREQIAQLRAGQHPSLHYDDKPEVEPGYRHVIDWTPARQIADVGKDGQGTGATRATPRQPRRWIEVTQKPRRCKKGGWAIIYRLHQPEPSPRYLRRLPPRTPATSAEPFAGALERERERRAAEESAYTSDPSRAIDPLEAIPADYVQPDDIELRRKVKRMEREDRRARLSVGGQLDSLLMDARTGHVDVRNDLRVISRRLAAMQEKVREAA